MSTHDDSPFDAASNTTAQHDLEPASPVPAAGPISHAPPPMANTAGPQADSHEEDTVVKLPPTGLALRAAVAQSASEETGLQPFALEEQLGPALLGALLSHKRTEGLAVPTPEAQARAKPYFERWVHTARSLGPAQTEQASVGRAQAMLPEAAAAQPDDVHDKHLQRDYPLALSLLPKLPPEYAESAEPAEQPAHTPAQPPRARPPAGAPSIRPAAVRRRQPADIIPQDLLQKASETALMWSEPSGATSFRIDFADDFFQDAACIITVSGKDVVATFYVEDVNARRLLEAESRRLQDSLEQRGLQHATVRIVTGAPPQPFAGDEEPAG
jgi:hypothetical protein